MRTLTALLCCAAIVLLYSGHSHAYGKYGAVSGYKAPSVSFHGHHKRDRRLRRYRLPPVNHAPRNYGYRGRYFPPQSRFHDPAPVYSAPHRAPRDHRDSYPRTPNTAEYNSWGRPRNPFGPGSMHGSSDTASADLPEPVELDATPQETAIELSTPMRDPDDVTDTDERN